MGKSYKKNIKDKNIAKKLNIRKEIREFDERFSFETEEELSQKIDNFLLNIKEEKRKKYILSYIRYISEKKEKQIRKLVRQKRNTNSRKIHILKESIEKEKKIFAYLNKQLEKYQEEKKKQKEKYSKKGTHKVTKIKENQDEYLPKIEERALENLKQGKRVIYDLESYYNYESTLRFYLKTSVLDDIYIQNIDYFINTLCHLEKEEELEKDIVENTLYFIIDILRQNIAKTSREDKKTREGYRRIKSKTEIYLEVYKEEKRKPKHNYYYDILEVLLTSPRNYYVIEKLLENIKEFVNAKTIVHHKEENYEKHILYTIIDLYIRSYKLELRNQTKDFVPKEYYKKVYYLFIQNSYLEVDKKEIYKLLNDFLASIENVNYLKNNKDKIIKEIESLLNEKEEKEVLLVTENVKNYLKYIEYQMIDVVNSRKERADKKYLEEIRYYYNKITSEFVNPTKQELKQVQKTLNMSNRTKRNITLGCETISFNDNHSYTISYYEDGAYSFRLNELDLHAIIKDTPLEEYLSKALDKGKNIVSGEEKIKIKEGRSFPSVTYEVRIEPNGKVGPLKIYLSTSEVEKYYDNIEDTKDEKLKRFLSLYKLLTEDHKPNLDKEIVDSYFLSLFENKIIEYVEMRNIPLIVKGISNFDEDYYMKLHYELCEIYSKIDKENFRKIFEILSTNLEKEHFVNHNYQKGNYYIHLENDYVKFLNQQMLKDYINQNEIEETYVVESNEIMEKANKGISYIGEAKPIDKKGKFVYHKK